MSTKTAPSPPLSTLHKGLNILEFIAKADRLIRLRDVVKEFSMDRSTALRFLKTLQHTGYIEKYEELKAYCITTKLAELHQPRPKLEQLIDQIKPYLVKLAQTTKQVAHLAVLQGENAILVGVENAPSRVRIKQVVGDMDPLYTSAVGKAIFANLPKEEQLSLGASITFIRQTAKTLPNLVALEKEAEQIRRQGIAFDDLEGSEDICCVACPIFDREEKVIFSIGVSMVAGLIDGSITEQQDVILAVRVIAEEISSAVIID